MRMIAFAPSYNTGKRHDATGAFQPEMRSFVKLHRASWVYVDNREPAKSQRESIVSAIQLSPCDVVAFFCHGSRFGLELGFDLRTVRELAKVLARLRNVRVVLYACSAAAGMPRGETGGDGGFADELRDELCKAGATDCQIDAHLTSGHTTKNPHVRRFEGRGSPVGGVGGYYLVPPRSPLWLKWRAALRSTDLRFRFPFLTVGELHAELAGR